MTHVSDYAHISPTAKLVADLRRFSDIPYSEEIARRIGATAALTDIVGKEHLDADTLRWMAPMIEARYQSLVHAIKKSGCKQVIEFAAGFSFRGVAMTREDPELRYIDTDLPEVHRERQVLLDELEKSGHFRASPRLVFAPVNLMVASEVDAVERMLEPGQPVAIVHEGLFQYLSHGEKHEAAARIHAILERHGGVWLTPDFDKLADAAGGLASYPQLAALGSFLAQATRRDVVRCAFRTDAQVDEFIDDEGFASEVTDQIDGSYPLTSARRLATTPQQIAQLTRSRKLWWLRPDGERRA